MLVHRFEAQPPVTCELCSAQVRRGAGMVPAGRTTAAAAAATVRVPLGEGLLLPAELIRSTTIGAARAARNAAAGPAQERGQGRSAAADSARAPQAAAARIDR